MKAVGQLFRW